MNGPPRPVGSREESRETGSRAQYYADYWRAPELEVSEHQRWKIERTREQVRVRTAPSVLDVGCGSGAVLSALRAPGIRLAGVEIAAEAASALTSQGIEGHAVDLEEDPLPFRDGEFDAVLCYDVLEHLFSPGRLLGEICRVVRPGGPVLLCVPNTLNLFNRLVFLGGEYVDVMDTSHRSEELFSNHIRLFSRALFERFVTSHPLRVVERHYYFPARFSDSRFVLPPWAARIVTAPRLHQRFPSALALGFLYVCETLGTPARFTATRASDGASRSRFV